MNKPVIFTAGIFVGAALFVSARTLMVNDAPAVERVSADADVLKSAQKVLDRDKELRTELDQREAYLEKAENKLGLAAPAGSDAAATKAKADKANVMTAVISGVMKQQMDMKMAGLKSRLNLSPDQEKAVQALLDKQAQVAQDLAQKMMDGASPDDLKQAAKDQSGDALNLDKQLQGILTPDQQAEYKNMQADDSKNQAETMANLQLSSIQGTLQLSDDQKDKVFNALLKAGPGSSDDAKKAALQPILTPEQFDAYSKQLATQAEMVQSFMIEKTDNTTDPSAPAPAAQ